MTLLRVIDREGVEHELTVTAGQKLMEILRELDYGVAAMCGGMCACATCHVYVDSEWLERLEPAMSDESELIQELVHRTERSRLSCQLEVTEQLSGLRVTIAPEE